MPRKQRQTGQRQWPPGATLAAFSCPAGTRGRPRGSDDPRGHPGRQAGPIRVDLWTVKVGRGTVTQDQDRAGHGDQTSAVPF